MPIPFQVLTGACNTNGQCVDSGLAHGADILAYGSGSHLFILGSHFERLQIIQDPQKRTITAVTCSNNGKVFLAAEDNIQVYEVTSLKDCLQDKVSWKQTGSFVACDTVCALSCDSDASHLVASSGLFLQLWEVVKAKAFMVGGDEYSQQNTSQNSSSNAPDLTEEWRNLATLQLENSINKVQFSPDGAFFATTCESDPMLKVWYKNTKDAEILSNTAPYAFTYLPHPYSVVSFSWRQNAFDIFNDTISNTLLSVCSDRVCRIWLEMAANQASSHSSAHQSHQQPPASSAPNTSLGSSRKISSVVKVNFVENSCVYESFRQFHLVASISPFADLPSPILADYLNTHPAASFCLFWLNNKHMAALQSLDHVVNAGKPRPPKGFNQKPFSPRNENGDESANGFKLGSDDEDDEAHDFVNLSIASPSKDQTQTNSPSFRLNQSMTSLQPFRAQLRNENRSRLSALQFALLRREWIHSPDMVVSFSPADGSFLLWVIDHLDKADGASFVQPTVTFTSCLPGTLPPSDAASLLPSPLLLYSDPHNHVTVVTVHDNGTLNRWSLSLTEKNKHSTVVSVYHGQRICGHRTTVEKIVVHPVLPVVVTQSPGELVFWKVTPTTQLHQSGGFAEVTRMVLQGTGHSVAWVPTSFSGSYSPCGVSPSTVFLLRSPNGFTAMQVIIDAYTFFSRLKKKGASGSHLPKPEDRFGIVSQQSASRPACVLKISHYQTDNSQNDCRMFHVFPISAFPMSQSNIQPRSSDISCSGGFDVSEFVAVHVVVSINGAVSLQSFHVTISSPLSKPSSLEGIAHNTASSPTEPLGPTNSLPMSLSSMSVVCESKMTIVMEPLSVVTLPLPMGVTLVHADASTSQPASSFLSNLCSPYQLVTGCSDGFIRFWSGIRSAKYELNWLEWKISGERQPVTDDTTELSVLKPQFLSQYPNAKIIAVSSAFSCRVAVACGRRNDRLFASPFTFNSPPISPVDGISGNYNRRPRPSTTTLASPFACQVVVYECESTGGYAWNVEDTLDLSNDSPSTALQEIIGSSPVDTLSAIKIRWSPVHDGSHLLVVLLVDRVYIFAQISSEIASQFEMETQDKEAARASESSLATTPQGSGPNASSPTERRHGLLQHAPLMATQSGSAGASTNSTGHRSSGVCWVRVRVFEIQSASAWNSGPVLPAFVSLLPTGLLVVGIGSELQIFSQWQGSSKSSSQQQQQQEIAPSQQASTSLTASTQTVPAGLSSVNVVGASRRPSVLSPTITSPPPFQQSDPAARSLADNVWLSVSSASFLQMHRTASFQSLARHTGAEVMPTVTEGSLSHHPPPNPTRQSLGSQSQQQNRAALQRSSSIEQARAAIRVLEDASLYELALATNPVLPQYHPKFLLELLKMGCVHCVDAILAHVVRSIFPDIRLSTNGESTQGEEMDDNAAEDAAVDRLSASARNFTGSELNAGPANGQDGSSGDSSSIRTVFVRPIPLHEVWALIYSASKSNRPSHHLTSASLGSTAEKLMSQLSSASTDSADTLTPLNIRARVGSLSASSAQPVFTETMARLLSVFLSKSRLPGLSNLDQMYLLALAGLVSARGKSDPGAQLYSQTLDACGSRFLLDMRHHHYLAQTLPVAHRSKIIQRGLSPASFLWAFHSESQDELLSLIPSVQRGEPLWPELKAYGVGYWLRNITSLKRLGEQLARASFQKTRDPLDAAVYYLAMKKKSVLAVLFKSHESVKMREFFKNDFSEDRWRKAALKNAFDLLAKQRFEHAIAFFLLADSLRDAIEVCISRLNDLQLALVISRLNDDSQQQYQTLMKTEILGANGSKRRSTDCFLLSLAHWVVGEHHQALSVLLDSSRGSNCDDFGHMTAVFGFYCHLKGHPLMRKLTSGRTFDDDDDDSLLSAHLERRTHFITAHSYLKAGCPVLALNVLCRMPALSDDSKEAATRRRLSTGMKQDSQATLVSQSKADDLDWSQPVSSGRNDDLVLSWSDEDEEKEDESEEKSAPPPQVENKAPRFVVTAVDEKSQLSKTNSLDSRADMNGDVNGPSSIEFATNCVAEQLKFICCLRLLADELTALCGGQTSSQLHQQLFSWLQNEFHLVSVMVSDSNVSSSSSSKSLVPAQLPMNLDASGDVHQLLENLAERRNWLAKNSHLLHCLLNFATLLAPTSTPLSLALNELCQLSQDLFAPKSQLTCKLPTTTSLPLVLAALSPIRACFQNVVSILFNLASDILLYLASVDRIWPPTPRLLSKLRAVRDLALTLSSSVYQSLCGCDLDPGRLRVVTTEPTKWPGVSQWSALLQQFADPDCPRLYLLLTRCLVAVHAGLFVYALANSDARALFRLIANPLNLSAWNRVFGGAKRMPVRQHAAAAPTQPQAVVQQPPTSGSSSALSSFASNEQLAGSPAQTGADKHRAAMARRAIEQRRPADDKIVYTEEFIAPTTTLASYFLRKPEPNLSLDYDTAQVINMDDAADEDDDDDDPGNSDHIDPNSRAWLILRIALIEQVRNMYRQFLPSLGVEHQDLVQLFPLIHALIDGMHRWSEAASADLRAIGPPPPPPEFVPDRTILSEPVTSTPTVGGVSPKPFDKYSCLQKHDNTPFIDVPSSMVTRRLWLYLVRQEMLRPLFIRHVFAPTSSTPINLGPSASQMSLQRQAESPDAEVHGSSSALNRSSPGTLVGKSGTPDLAVKMIHKDQEPVGAFCINQNNLNCVALALSKEILQLDIGVMLHPPVWVESDLEYDIETMLVPQPTDGCNVFTVTSTRQPGFGTPTSGSHGLPQVASLPVLPPSAPGVIPAAINQTGASALTAYGANVLKTLQTPFQVLDRSRRLVKQLAATPLFERLFDLNEKGVVVVEFPFGETSSTTSSDNNQNAAAADDGQLCKNNVAHARYMSSHPTQPFFLVGCQNKTISCWQWGHWSAVVNYELEPRLNSHLTALKWSDYGNKFGVAEHSGTMRLCLSHVGKTNRPFWAQREAHSTALADFCFLDSASVLATVGTSSDNNNLRLWDTLLPTNSQIVQSYVCHDGGCNAVAFSKRYNVLLTAGKKGEVALFDLRRSDPLCLLSAHEQSAIRCIALDPMEKCFATGAADGDVKIWSLGSDIHLIAHLPAEHKVRGIGAGFVGSQAVGVTQLVIDPEHRLYSCGADGSFRVRTLTSLLV